MTKFTRSTAVCLGLFLTGVVEGFAGPFTIKVTRKPHNDDMVSEILVTSNAGKMIKTIEQDGFVVSVLYNKTRTLCAINCRPGTQINVVYIITASPSGKIRIMEDFTDTIADALRSINDNVPTDYLEVENISNKTFNMYAGTKGEHHYEFNVEYTKQGKFRIIPKSITRAD